MKIKKIILIAVALSSAALSYASDHSHGSNPEMAMGEPTAIGISTSIEVNRSADDIWNELKTFRHVEKVFPNAVVSSKTTGAGVGCQRACKLPDGTEIVENLLIVDDLNRRLVYTIEGLGGPVSEVIGSLSISDNGYGKSTVTMAPTLKVPENMTEQFKVGFTKKLQFFLSDLKTSMENS